jgi:hypothetical protein
MEEKNPYAVALGSLGGRKRMSSLTDKQKKALARKAGKASGKARSKRAQESKPTEAAS